MLITEGHADVEATDTDDDFTPLMHCALFGHEKVAMVLLEQGFHGREHDNGVAHGAMTERSSMTMYANRAKPADGYTALLLAASQNHLKLVRALLRCRAEVNQATHSKFSPLMAASAKPPFIPSAPW